MSNNDAVFMILYTKKALVVMIHGTVT